MLRALSDASRAAEGYIVLSDVHLGHDLDTPAGKGEGAKIDDDLCRLIAHYRATPPASAGRAPGQWHLVIAGDFIDFIGITSPPPRSLATAPSDEELAHGIGSAVDHATFKLERVAERHARVFAALASFVADGHRLTIVHGNHDVEFYWDPVKQLFRDTLVAHAVAAGSVAAGPEAARCFADRIEFHEWFFYVDGVAYIEHGHQYDSFCATEHVMTPLSPLDPRRIARGFTHVLLRFVVKRMKGVSEHGHEHRGLAFYLGLPFRLGLRGGFDLTRRFVNAVVELFRLRRQHFSEAARALAAEHERRMTLLAEARRIGLDRIQALAALQAPPITRSIRGILASVLLDRLALGIASMITLATLAVALGVQRGQFWVAAVGLLVAWAALHRQLVLGRQVDPAEILLDRAGRLAKLFPAAFVVMGHTHVPAKVPVNEGASTYINLGAWAEADDAADGAYRAPRTHLVIELDAGRPRGELLAWDSTLGPRRFGG